VGVDNTGMSGVEYAFDDQIRGRAAKVAIQIDARRRAVGHAEKPSTEGRTVVLTLDESIQHSAERELDRALAETAAVSGVIVVMDPATGEILALANRPAFNPNRFAAYPSSRWKNRAVADAYEPGSIFKIFTAAAALQEGVVDPDETIDCGNGFIEIAGTRIDDHHVFDQLTFRDVIAKSSDIGVIRVAQRLGRESFNRYMRAFGFGTATGVELPGESSGLLRPPSRWSALSLASLSFGQEVGVTALQITSAVGAVANGGYLMKPYVVRAMEDAAGRVVKSYKPVAVRRVLEPHTVEVLTDLLKGVVQTAPEGGRCPGTPWPARRHRAEDRRLGPLLDDRPRRLLRGLRARAPGRRWSSWSRSTRRAGALNQAATWPRPSSRGWRRTPAPPGRPSEDPDRVLRATVHRRVPATPAAYRPPAPRRPPWRPDPA
jgi:cell division protein FtsI (penicillin-binding protein 3)